MKQNILAAFGFFMILLGGIGLLVPVLPTTPFVLVAAGCFAGHPRLRGWLDKSRFFSAFIRNYEQHCGLPRRMILISLCFLWGMLGISILTVGKMPIALGLAGIGLAVTVHILYISKPRRGQKIQCSTKHEDDS